MTTDETNTAPSPITISARVMHYVARNPQVLNTLNVLTKTVSPSGWEAFWAETGQEIIQRGLRNPEESEYCRYLKSVATMFVQYLTYPDSPWWVEWGAEDLTDYRIVRLWKVVPPLLEAAQDWDD